MTAFPLTVVVTPNAVKVRPGGTAKISVEVKNVSDIVQHYKATIVGLSSDDYWASEPAVVKLVPGNSGQIDVKIHIPEKGGIPGGRTVLGVLVTSPYQPDDVSRSVDLILDVETVAGIELSATPTTAEGRTSATYELSLTNGGNIDDPVDLVATDDHGEAQIVITPPVLHIRPGESQVAEVNIRVRGILTGQERRSTISIKAQAGGDTRGDVSVTFVQTPWITPGVLRVLGIALGVMILAGATLAGAMIGKERRESATSGPTQAGQTMESPRGQGNVSPPPTTSSPPTSPTGPSPPTSPTGGGSASTPPLKPTLSQITVVPSVPAVGSEAVLSATATPADVTWSWEISDASGKPVKTATDPEQFPFTFPQAGTFTVKLKVTDGAGQDTEGNLQVEVTAPPPALEVVPKDIQVQPTEVASNAAECSKDRLALSGGVDVLSDGAVPPATMIRTSLGTGDDEALVRWTASVVNPSANKIDIAIKVICAAKPEGYVVTTDSSTTVEAGTSNEKTLPCPQGLVVLGGGGGLFSGTAVDTDSFLEESRPVETDGQWNGWRVRARNNAGTAQSLTAQIICAKKPNGYEVRSKPQDAPATPDHRINELVACPAGSAALSGGAGITNEIARDIGTQTVLRESTLVAPPEGSDVEQWLTHMSVKAGVTQSVTAYAICAALPR